MENTTAFYIGLNPFGKKESKCALIHYDPEKPPIRVYASSQDVLQKIYQNVKTYWSIDVRCTIHTKLPISYVDNKVGITLRDTENEEHIVNMSNPHRVYYEYWRHSNETYRILRDARGKELLRDIYKDEFPADDWTLPRVNVINVYDYSAQGLYNILKFQVEHEHVESLTPSEINIHRGLFFENYNPVLKQ